MDKNKPMFEICPKVLAAVGVITIGAVECVALLTGHNGNFFNLAVGAIVAITSGTPFVQNLATKRTKASEPTQG